MFKCKRCGYETTRRHKFRMHLRSKLICPATLSAIPRIILEDDFDLTYPIKKRIVSNTKIANTRTKSTATTITTNIISKTTHNKIANTKTKTKTKTISKTTKTTTTKFIHKCRRCGYKTTRRNDYYKHLYKQYECPPKASRIPIIMLRNSYNSYYNKEICPEIIFKRYQCKFCEKVFNKSQGKYKHQKWHCPYRLIQK
jgi:hypothetical protein